MEWAHCNRCYLRPYERSVPFFTTACARVVCDACCPSGEDGRRRCLFCEDPCAVLRISAEMPEKFAEYFRDPMEIFKRLLKICQFQHSQREHLLEYEQKKMKQAMETSESAKEEYSKLKESLNELSNENKRIGLHNEEMNERIKKFKSCQKKNTDMTPPCQEVTTLPLGTPVRRDGENRRSDNLSEDPRRFTTPPPSSSFATPKQEVASPGSSAQTPEAAEGAKPKAADECTPGPGTFQASPLDLSERPKFSKRAQDRVKKIFAPQKRV